MCITQEEYNKYRIDWTTKKEEYETKLAKISTADKEYYITASYLLELASRSYELFLGSEPEQKRQIITLTLQNLTIDNGKLRYEWIKPFDSIFVSAQGHTWGQQSEPLQTFYPTTYIIDITNLQKLEDVENAYELAVIESKASNLGVIDFNI